MQTGTFKISWTEAKGVKSYEILIVDNKGFAAKIIRDIKSTEAVVTHEIADLPQGRYFLRVSGVESSGAKATALTDRRNEAYEFLMAPSPAGTWSVLKPSAPLLTARTDAAVAATSKGILVWGGSTPKGIAQDGAIYNPTANAWTPMATLNSPEPRIGPSAWTGSLLALWGGSDFDIGTYKSSKVLNTGATYNPSSDQWTPMAAAGAPTPRQGHTLTVMGDSIFVWGGVNRPSMDEKSAATLGDGGIYNTVTQTWTPVTSSSGSTRAYHCSVWTGTHVIVWGGAQKNPDEDFSLTASGEMFDPATREWRPISNQGQPIARYVHNCVWTGKKMLVWGGHVRFFALANGAAYDPQTNTWSPMEDTKAPIPVVGEGYHWTGKYFMVWGGRQGESNLLQLGGLYDPEKNQWQFTSLEGAPSPRWGTPLTGQGNKVYFFGGDSVQKGANPPGKIYDELVEFTVPP